MARIMAIAWRDAAMRLVPPVTKQQFRNRLRSSNTSGVPGVSSKYNQGQLVAWRASLQTPERSHFKSFSTKIYGEERAKELAIAARQHLLDRYGSDSFINLNEKSRQDFAHLLEHPQSTPDPAQAARHLDALNQWFDQLLPEQLSVGLTVANASMTASMRIASFGQRYDVVTKSLQLIRRPYPQRLPEWWQFMETTITARHGRERWQAFAARHEAAFMASTAESGFRVRHYSAPFNYPHCLTPPALLQPMLAGFELPALPYLKAQDTSFVAHPSKTAMMPPAAKPSAKTTSVETHL